jgi:hypothetical protein
MDTRQKPGDGRIRIDRAAETALAIHNYRWQRDYCLGCEPAGAFQFQFLVGNGAGARFFAEAMWRRLVFDFTAELQPAVVRARQAPQARRYHFRRAIPVTLCATARGTEVTLRYSEVARA